MSSRSHSVVAVLSGGLSLSLAACAGKDAPIEPGNPPVPEQTSDGAAEKAGPSENGPHSGRTPADHAIPTANPPPPVEPELPVWDEVASGHPEGATNPPRPVLVVLEDRSRCWKEWLGGMVPPPKEVRDIGGRVITDPSQTTGTEIRCDLRRVQNIMDRRAAMEAEGGGEP